VLVGILVDIKGYPLNLALIQIFMTIHHWYCLSPMVGTGQAFALLRRMHGSATGREGLYRGNRHVQMVTLVIYQIL
jgi:hypothetical protein